MTVPFRSPAPDRPLYTLATNLAVRCECSPPKNNALHVVGRAESTNWIVGPRLCSAGGRAAPGRPPRAGLSTQIAIRNDPASETYYDRKPSDVNTHTHAVMPAAAVSRTTQVIEEFVMLYRDRVKTHLQPQGLSCLAV
jgi:hypothetical protein